MLGSGLVTQYNGDVTSWGKPVMNGVCHNKLRSWLFL